MLNKVEPQPGELVLVGHGEHRIPGKNPITIFIRSFQSALSGEDTLENEFRIIGKDGGLMSFLKSYLVSKLRQRMKWSGLPNLAVSQVRYFNGHSDFTVMNVTDAELTSDEFTDLICALTEIAVKVWERAVENADEQNYILTDLTTSSFARDVTLTTEVLEEDKGRFYRHHIACPNKECLNGVRDAVLASLKEKILPETDISISEIRWDVWDGVYYFTFQEKPEFPADQTSTDILFSLEITIRRALARGRFCNDSYHEY